MSYVALKMAAEAVDSRFGTEHVRTTIAETLPHLYHRQKFHTDVIATVTLAKLVVQLTYKIDDLQAQVDRIERG